MVIEVWLSDQEYRMIERVGCASFNIIGGKNRSRPIPSAPIKFPNSTELLLMANTEWKNRIERKHTHDCIPWVDGWIHGFLTPHPEWRKRSAEHNAAIAAKAREEERERIDEVVKKLRGMQRKWDNNMKEEWGQSLKRDYSKGAAMAFAEAIDLLVPPESLRPQQPQEREQR
jgi:hypothetical protein